MREGQEFLVNIYEGGELDVHLVDSATPADEMDSLLLFSIGRPDGESAAT